MTYGFDEGKNKEAVYKTSEVLPVVHAEFDPLINAKQDQHTTATATLAAADWSELSQTVSVTGVTASNTIIVSANPASVDEYSERGIICTAQGAGALTFTCKTVPANDVTVNVIILEV